MEEIRFNQWMQLVCLQFQMHNVPFSIDPGDAFQGIKCENGNSTRKLCPIPIQKETPSGLVDTVCNGDIDEQSAGLCR